MNRQQSGLKTEGIFLQRAIEVFEANKEAQGIKPRVRAMYSRELKRLRSSGAGRPANRSSSSRFFSSAWPHDRVPALRRTCTPFCVQRKCLRQLQRLQNHPRYICSP